MDSRGRVVYSDGSNPQDFASGSDPWRRPRMVRARPERTIHLPTAMTSQLARATRRPERQQLIAVMIMAYTSGGSVKAEGLRWLVRMGNHHRQAAIDDATQTSPGKANN